MKYFRELDGLRAVAIIVVIIHHWHPYKTIEFLTSRIDGVAIFFVLSGFLISNILFANRDKAEASGSGKIICFRNFFFRRALRIFPLYYLVLLAVFFLGHRTSIYGWPFYVTYTSNFYIYHIREWGELTHFWSLAVEEQFYFVWPFFILFANRRFILPLIILFILMGVIFQFGIIANQFVGVLTPACLTSLGLGSLLSWLNLYKPLTLRQLYPWISATAMASLILIIFQMWWYDLSAFHFRTLSSVITFWLIAHILRDKVTRRSLMCYILQNRILVSIGKISYSLYIFHHILPYYSNAILAKINLGLPYVAADYQQQILFLENLGIVLVLSCLSWKFFEKPLLRLKKNFDYHEHKTKPVITSLETSGHSVVV